ncbi:Sodium/calcium exchanger protein-domain-containing protein [Ochromonadaceae sp. CCMP2298]|nr:Sodium/calcium exchanger protein-domain-containing protein [Ochromonadaceae sp. CCMP2298]
MVSYWMHWASGVTFILSLLALAPLAERLGFVTEQLAMHTNETIGGLLNATFGNATELIVAITALKRGLFRLVQLSLLGSILSNMLLVLGTAFWVGGYYHKIQKFGTISSQINSTLLMIATMGILFPTILTNSAEEDNAEELGYSRGTSIVLFLLYFAFLYFQLFSHKFLYEERPEETEKLKESMMDPKLVDTHPKGSDRAFAPVNRVLSRGNSVTSQERQGSLTSTGYLSTEDAALRLHPAIEEGVDGFMAKGGSVEDEEDEEEEEEDMLGLNWALFWLAIMTVFIAILSDAISGSIEEAAEGAGISKVFLAAIVLPIVGNAAEHAGAVMFAAKGKLDLSLGVAIGSSTQIGLCVLPLLVIIGWIGGYDLSLNFGDFESATLFLSVVAVTFAIKDGYSNWMLGISLVFAYIIIAMGFWAHHDEELR